MELVPCSLILMCACSLACSTDTTAALGRASEGFKFQPSPPGYNRHLLEEACRLMHDEASGTTLAVEQQHGSIAVVHRAHPDLGMRMASIRSYLHMCRFLLREPLEMRQHQRLVARVASVRRRLRHGVSARNAYMKELHAATKEANPGASVARAVLARHHDLYEALPPCRKRRYEELAAEMTRERERDLLADAEHAEVALSLFEARQRSERALVGKTNASGEVRFDEGDFAQMDTAIAEGAFPAVRVEAAIARDLEPPPALTSQEQRTLDGMDAVDDHRGADKPQWLKELCHRRLELVNVVLHANKVGYENIGYKFLYALQQPLSATFMALRRRGWHPGQYGPDDMADFVAPFLFEYSYSYAEYVAETALPFEPDGSDILIVPEATFIGQGRLVSDLAFVPWPNFIEGFSYSRLL